MKRHACWIGRQVIPKVLDELEFFCGAHIQDGYKVWTDGIAFCGFSRFVPEVFCHILQNTVDNAYDPFPPAIIS